MSKSRLLTILGGIFITSFLTFVSVNADHPDSLYVYDLRNAAQTVDNSASVNQSATMQFAGDWSSTPEGVVFEGNTTSLQSGGHAAPSSGLVIDEPASASVGAAAIFTQTGGCGADSQNVSQIGPFASATSQIKLQLSKCRSGDMYPECRIAGQNTPTRQFALRGTPVLSEGASYKLECVKSPDQGGSSTVTMRTTDMATTTTTTDTFDIPATGPISSSRDVTAGNKYPIPSQSSNTDQFTGTITILGYCASSDVATTQSCLDTEVSTDSTPPTEPPVAPPTEPPVEPPVSSGSADEIKFSYGDTRDEVVFSWRGDADVIYYGTDQSYGNFSAASESDITPVDIEGPFMEARISGLSYGTTYHYKIGTDGADGTFTTAAGDNDDVYAVAIGDTIASDCRTYQNEMNSLITSMQPHMVLHHGDMSIANECGVPAVHQFYMDLQNSYSTFAAFMPVWGNHEYGKPTTHAPAGTPRDSLANYKGRSAIPNAQTVPNDSATKTSHPGCGAEIGSSVNTCRGEDWGWFRSGRVLFISYPEPWWKAIMDWRSKADALMTQAQNDPSIDFVVTYGHRPVISSTGYTPPKDWATAFSQLANSHSPSSTNPDGKYVLDLTGHRHNMEVFSDWNNLTQVVNGGGGQGLINFKTILNGSSFRAKHLGFSTLSYDAQSRTLTFAMVCGPSHSNQDVTCTAGDVLYTQQFSR